MASATAWMGFLGLIMVLELASAERLLKITEPAETTSEEPGLLARVSNFLWQGGKSSYKPVWPVSFKLS